MKKCLIAFAFVVCVPAMHARANIVTYTNYSNFINNAGPLSTLDFDTLPGGAPTSTNPSAMLTDTFNYDVEGAHFTAPGTNPRFSPATGGDYRLLAIADQHTYFDVLLTNPGPAVGIIFGGQKTLCAFDSNGVQLRCATNGTGGGPFFVGFVSDLAIARVTVDANSDSVSLSDFIFSSVPEPGTLMLLCAGATALLRRRR